MRKTKIFGTKKWRWWIKYIKQAEVIPTLQEFLLKSRDDGEKISRIKENLQCYTLKYTSPLWEYSYENISVLNYVRSSDIYSSYKTLLLVP